MQNTKAESEKLIQLRTDRRIFGVHVTLEYFAKLSWQKLIIGSAMLKLNQNGFSLVEVLISIFVLSVGALGAAAMQLSALRTTQQSAFHTIAFQLATEMADRMRANQYQMKQDDDQNPFLKLNFKSEIEPVVPDTFCFAVMANCQAVDLAKFDIYEWEKRIKKLLPNGRALICRDSKPWNSTTFAGQFVAI